MKGVVLPLAITLAVQAITSMAMIAPSVMAPVAAAELGVSAHGIGWFVGLEYLFAMLSGLAGGRIPACACAPGLTMRTWQDKLLPRACLSPWSPRCAKQ